MSKKVELNDEDQQLENARVYELGFHFVPTIAEDEVAVQFSHLKSLIEKRGGQFIAEEMPKLKDLAYTISQTIKGQKKKHSSAYFGWVKFSIDASEVVPLEKEVKLFAPILRYLLIKTVAENTFLGAVSNPKKSSKTKSEDDKEESDGEIKVALPNLVAEDLIVAEGVDAEIAEKLADELGDIDHAKDSDRDTDIDETVADDEVVA